MGILVDSILLSASEETESEDYSRYNLRQNRSGRQSRGRRSKSANMDRSRSRQRRGRRSSAEHGKVRSHLEQNIFRWLAR